MLGIMVLVLGLMACWATIGDPVPTGTVFTYQGRLTDTNIAANGIYDFEFTLYDEPISGSPLVEPPVRIDDLDVIDGYFTAELDFGPVFDGGARWIEIAVRPGESEDLALFTILEPRQQLMPAPYALYALSGNEGPPGPQGPPGPPGEYVGIAPVSVDNVGGIIGLNAGTDAGDLMTWDGNNWVARQPAVQHFTINNMQPFTGVNFIIAMQGIFPSRNGIEPFIAEIIMFGGDFAPRGWAFCDGQLLAINQNDALFSLLGTTYGGDGRTTFALPDLRGRVPLHPGDGPGLTNRNLGERGGSELTGR